MNAPASPRLASSLTGKWALVTGSSRGIGRQIALGLAARHANVILHGRALDHLQETRQAVTAFGAAVRTVAGDLAQPEGVESVWQQLQHGPAVDILYNNAAIMNAWKPLWELAPAEWQQVFQVNVWAPIRLCQALAPGMKQRGFGRIINLSSGIKDTPHLAPYSVSKAALDKYTRDLAAELRGTGVLVNGLDPGWLRTDMGGPEAPLEVTSVLPGALVPALLTDEGPGGCVFSAQAFPALDP
jgi:NAD(P)-dependent dehydrogenase (short-subunit alcohol dehydrogenase family)